MSYLSCNDVAKDIADFLNDGNGAYADILKKAHMLSCSVCCDLDSLVKQYQTTMSAPVPEGTPVVIGTPITGRFKHAKREFVVEKIEGENAVIRYKGERGTYDVKIKDLQNEKDVELDKPLPDANGFNSTSANEGTVTFYSSNGSNSVVNSAPNNNHPPDCNCDDCLQDYWAGQIPHGVTLPLHINRFDQLSHELWKDEICKNLINNLNRMMIYSPYIPLKIVAIDP